MKNREDIDIDQALKNFLAAYSPEQLIAELETPSRAELMAIPDEDFFFTLEAEPIPLVDIKAFGIEQTFNLLGDLSFGSDYDPAWQNPPKSSHLVDSACSMTSAANQELALAA